MRVYIGPYDYSIRWATHLKLDYMHMRGIVSWEKPEKLVDKIVCSVFDGVQHVLNFAINRPFLDNIKRKTKVRIDKYDIWGADHTLALVILPLLKEIKKRKNGSPWVDDKDVPKHLRSTAATLLTEEQKANGTGDEFYHKRWDYVLDEMIYAFEVASDENFDDQFYTGDVDYKFNDETNTLEQGPNHTFEVDRKGLKKAYARADEGRRLFAKYYNGLWD